MSQSQFNDYIDARRSQAACEMMQNRPSHAERSQSIHENLTALSVFQSALDPAQLEWIWIKQLFDYVQRIRSCEPSIGPQDQFERLYTLRKWLYWVPVQLLQQTHVDVMTLLTVAHFYAVAIELEMHYPDVGPRFFGSKVSVPLGKVLWRVAEMSHHDIAALERLSEYPQRALQAHAARWDSLPSFKLSPLMSDNFDPKPRPLSANLNLGDMSPCFTPMHVKHEHKRASSSFHSSTLEVPNAVYAQPQDHGFSHNTSQWGSAPSPMFPSSDFFAAMQNDMQMMQPDSVDNTIIGGFVAPALWT